MTPMARSRSIAFTVIAAVLGACHIAQVPANPNALGTAPADSVYAMVNGRWMDGDHFAQKTKYVRGGVFLAGKPSRVDRTIDLAGAFVTPPFADAHTHNLDGSFRLDTVVDAYVHEGTFYVQVLTNASTGAAAVRSRFNRPGALDVAYANGGLSATLGHPFDAYEPRHLGIYTGAQEKARFDELCASRQLEGNVYWSLDSPADIAAKWPRILATHPDVIKIFLLHSEAFHATPSCAEMGRGGLNPILVPDIVAHAHAAGLKVWAHIESAHDFSVAAKAGVDGFAHVPGYDLARTDSNSTYEISQADAQIAGAHRTFITPTASLALANYSRGDSVQLARTRELERRNLRMLERAGVKVVVGSDYYGRTAAGEVDALHALGLWSNPELVRMWAVTTPRAIFPLQRIGAFDPGYEASFLALSCDPFADLQCTHAIAVRMKQGILLEIGAAK
jgi:imidazolonepropionase-like amidohydrolase